MKSSIHPPIHPTTYVINISDFARNVKVITSKILEKKEGFYPQRALFTVEETSVRIKCDNAG